jgi:hypothetical protein
MGGIIVSVEVDIDEIVDEIARDDGCAFDTIVRLDDAVVDWDFTKRLFEYFSSQMAEFEDEKDREEL